MAVTNHKTARLVLELMSVDLPYRERVKCPQHQGTCGCELSRPSAQDKNPRDSGIFNHTNDLRRAISTASTSPLSPERSSTRASSTGTCTTTSWEYPDKLADEVIWDESDDESDDLDRSRALAAACVSEDPASPVGCRWTVLPADCEGHSPDDLSGLTQSTLDEMDHPKLTGPLGALHGYAANDGDVVLLEKAYDMARNVAAKKQNIHVALDAYRIALAAGYIHSVKRNAPEVARKFAVYHSLPRLAQSLKQYWCSEGELCSPVRESDWEQCMLSLLEANQKCLAWELTFEAQLALWSPVDMLINRQRVISSVSLITGDTDILSILDAQVGPGLAEDIGMYCALRPVALLEYPQVGRECLRRHEAAVRAIQYRDVRS